MNYNILEKENIDKVNSDYKKHRFFAMFFSILAILIFILSIVISTRDNMQLIIILGTILISICLILVSFIYFNFLKIEKDYLQFIKKVQIQNVNSFITTINSGYTNETSYFNKIPCYVIKITENEKIKTLYLEKSNAPKLSENKTYLIKTFRHFIIEIKEYNNEVNNK